MRVVLQRALTARLGVFVQWRTGGLRGLYRGFGITALRDTVRSPPDPARVSLMCLSHRCVMWPQPAFGVYFWTYDQCKNWFVRREALRRNVAPSQVPMLPSWMLMVSASQSRIWSACSLLTLCGDRCRRPLQMSGGIAGTMSWALLHPVDVVKSCVQALPDNLPEHVRGPLAVGSRRAVFSPTLPLCCTTGTHCVCCSPCGIQTGRVEVRRWTFWCGCGSLRTLTLLARDGYHRFFFRGYAATMTRAFPNSAVTFLVYEWIVHHTTTLMGTYYV